MALLRYFSWVREKIGVASESIPLPEEITTVAKLRDFLAARGPTHAELLNHPTLRIAVNQRYAQPGDPVADGDEIAIFPPVSGG
ncbi:MAG: molybdopterin converting factor subunit 1 [Magnetococcales bacterium]|nr:molybdopterin converting factor subunit 1 [Magnetococcales bacterium]